MSRNELYLIKEAEALIENIGANLAFKKYIKTAKADLIKLYAMIGKYRLGRTRPKQILLGRSAVAVYLQRSSSASRS